MIERWAMAVCVLALCSMTAAGADKGKTAKQQTPLRLQTRLRVPVEKGSPRFHTVNRTVEWSPKQTAIIVCDMWDLHHCLNATRRGAEMAPRMNQVLTAARKRGITIIHAPSSCMKAYENHPARKHAQNTPRSENLPKDIGSWCYVIPAEQKGVYPIDQSDGGEDDDLQEHQQWAEKLRSMGRNPKSPWVRQIDVLDIKDEDAISDNGVEIWNLLQQRRIQNVILVGVHTNMCVLGRPFGLRQMAKNGKNVVLVRDLTDTMYNPLRAPYVSHFSGTDLIVEHIEKLTRLDLETHAQVAKQNRSYTIAFAPVPENGFTKSRCRTRPFVGSVQVAVTAQRVVHVDFEVQFVTLVVVGVHVAGARAEEALRYVAPVIVAANLVAAFFIQRSFEIGRYNFVRLLDQPRIDAVTDHVHETNVATGSLDGARARAVAKIDDWYVRYSRCT